MQIWRSTRSPPGTSCMKARLVRPLYFVLLMLPQKILASLSISGLFYFAMPASCCVSECHQKRAENITSFPVRENSGSM